MTEPEENPPPPARGLHLTPSASRPARGPVILVHGIWMVGAEMLWLASCLRRAGFGPVRQFHYPSVRHGLAENARRLADFRRRVEARHGPAHLVGHSLGGVLIWQLFHDHGENAPGGRVVALGAPFQGSATARFFLRRGMLGRFAVGACWREEADHSPAVERTWPGPAALGILAGRVPIGVGALVGALPRPNDGVVALGETPLAGAADHRVLGVNHVALTLADEATRQTTHFLAHGRFAGAEEVGFEPTEPHGSPVFKTGALNRSATLP